MNIRTLTALICAAALAQVHAATTDEALALCEPVAESSMTVLLEAAEKRTCAPAFFATKRAAVAKGRDMSPSLVKFVIDESIRACVVYPKRPTQDKATFDKVLEATVAVARHCSDDADTLLMLATEEVQAAKVKRLQATP